MLHRLLREKNFVSAGDAGLLPGGGNSNPLQYPWASLKNPPAMRKTWVPSLGGEDPLEKEMATHSSILAWEIP